MTKIINSTMKILWKFSNKILLNSSRNHNKPTKLLILFLLPLLLCSCWDYNDINARNVVLTNGIDYDSIANNYTFFGEVAKFSSTQVQQGVQEKGSNVYNFSGQGTTFEATRLHSDSSNSKPTFLGASTVVIFGKTLAEKGIEPYLHRIDGIADYRKTLLAVVSKESAEDLLKFNISKDVSVGFYIENNLHWLTASGKALYTTISEMLSAIYLGDVGYLMPYVGIQANDIRYLGLAVMKNSKLIDIINIKDTNGLLYLLAKNPTLIEGMPSSKNSNNILSFQNRVKKRKIKVEYINNTPVININLEINSELRYQYYIEPISKEELKKWENSLSSKIKTDIQTIITRSQKEFQCDIFNFIKYFKADYPNVYKKIDWKEAYSTAKVNIMVSTKIIDFDLDDPNAKIKNSKDEHNEK